MKVFTADIGNTRAKLGCFEKNQPVQIAETALEVSALLAQATDEDTAIMSASGSNVLEAELQSVFGNRLQRLSHLTSLPIHLQIDSPQTLGPDRIAAVCGAAAQFPNTDLLVISAGTCITFNLLTADQVFRGGLIVPGLQMRFDAMHHFTAALPQLSADTQLSGLYGNNTFHAMQYGVLEGVCAEVNAQINRFRLQFPAIQVVATGGDAYFLASRIKNRIFADPNLLMKGLYQIYLHQ